MFGGKKIVPIPSSESNLTLRRAQHEDLGFIKNISLSEMKEIVAPSWNWKSWFNGVSTAIDDAFHDVFIIMFKEEEIGYLWLNEETHYKSLWITAIVITHLWQRRRIGERIMTYLISEARKNGKKFIELGVQSNNLGAKRFYAKFGFQKHDHFQYANTDVIRLKTA